MHRRKFYNVTGISSTAIRGTGHRRANIHNLSARGSFSLRNRLKYRFRALAASVSVVNGALCSRLSASCRSIRRAQKPLRSSIPTGACGHLNSGVVQKPRNALYHGYRPAALTLRTVSKDDAVFGVRSGGRCGAWQPAVAPLPTPGRPMSGASLPRAGRPAQPPPR